MTTALEMTLQKLSSRPLSEGELALGAFRLTGAVNCLLKMKRDLEREGGHINKGINEGTGRRALTSCPKYTPVRIC
jgi:hypothetical protein